MIRITSLNSKKGNLNIIISADDSKEGFNNKQEIKQIIFPLSNKGYNVITFLPFYNLTPFIKVGLKKEKAFN